MPGVLSREIKDEVNSLLASTRAAKTIFNEVIDVLKEAKLCTLQKNVACTQFFVHPKNRSRLGLNPYQSHRGAAKILRAGADKAQLLNAFAIELQPEPCPQRDEAIAFNKRITTRSKGLLAGRTGEERYLSVGCGHTVAFCKAVLAGCQTPEDNLKDARGMIDTHKLYQDKVFKSMVTEGWDWWIISASVDRECPRFAIVAQKALNACNHVPTLVGELEAAQMLAQHLHDGAADDDEYVQSAIDEVRSIGCPCAPYCEHIMKFVQLFAGGESAPHIQFIDAVAKQFKGSASLGAGVRAYPYLDGAPPCRSANVLPAARPQRATKPSLWSRLQPSSTSLASRGLAFVACARPRAAS